MKMFLWLWPPGSSDILSQQLLLSQTIPQTEMQQNKQKPYIPFPSILPYNCCLQNSWSSGIAGAEEPTCMARARLHPGLWVCKVQGSMEREAPLQQQALSFAVKSLQPLSHPIQLTSSIKLNAAMTVLYLKHIWDCWGSMIAIPEGIPWPLLSI